MIDLRLFKAAAAALPDEAPTDDLTRVLLDSVHADLLLLLTELRTQAAEAWFASHPITSRVEYATSTTPRKSSRCLDLLGDL